MERDRDNFKSLEKFERMIQDDNTVYLDLNELDGLAIMSDTDNSQMKSIAYYQNIYFSAE